MAVRVAGGSRRAPWMLAAVLAASAAAADEVPEDLRRCAAIEGDSERLACYDDYVASGAAERVAQERSASASPPAAAEASAEARFGLPHRAEDEVDEISATITDIVVRANQERIFTLDNGQVWVEDSPRTTLRLEVGDRVTIRAGSLGSHRLFGSSNRSTAVDRVR